MDQRTIGRVVAASLATLCLLACETKSTKPHTSPSSGAGGGVILPVGGGPTTTTTAVTGSTSAAVTTAASTGTGGVKCGNGTCTGSEACISNANGDFCSNGTPGAPCGFNTDCASGACDLTTLTCL